MREFCQNTPERLFLLIKKPVKALQCLQRVWHDGKSENSVFYKFKLANSTYISNNKRLGCAQYKQGGPLSSSINTLL